MNEVSTGWKPTMDLRHVLEWEDDGTRLVLQQRWERSTSEDEAPGCWRIEEEWRDIPLWKYLVAKDRWVKP